MKGPWLGLAASVVAVGLLPVAAQAGDTKEVVAHEADISFTGAPDDRYVATTTFRIPTEWRRTSSRRAPTARFTYRLSAQCSARIQATAGGFASRTLGPVRQVRRATRFALADLGDGERPRGAWGVIEARTPVGDPVSARYVFGIASVRVAPRRFIQVRSTATMTTSCTHDKVRTGALPAAMRRLVRTADVRGHLVD